jgi:peptidyl-prolyl cis-trans isomerase C
MRARSVASVVALSSILTLVPIRALLANAPAPGASPASPAPDPRRKAIAVRVGPTEVTVGEIEDRLAAVPRFQLRAFGDTPESIRRKFFDQVLLPEILYALEAGKRHIADVLPTSSKVMRAEANAANKIVRQAVRPAASITPAEIHKYYDDNNSKYDSPERLYLFRILCLKREEAIGVLAEARKEPTLEAFTRLARDHSIDKATSLRGGNLGYLTPDGLSTEAGVSVDPSIVKAALMVKDGDIVPAPIPEGLGYAVIWRRGSLPPSHRTADDAAGEIRESIFKHEVDEASRTHIEALRAVHVTDLNEALLNGIDLTSTEADVVTRRRPGEVPALSQGGRNVPRPVN